MRGAMLAGFDVDAYGAAVVLNLHPVGAGVDHTGVGIRGEYGAPRAGVPAAVTLVPSRDREIEEVGVRRGEHVLAHRPGLHLACRIPGCVGGPLIWAAAQRFQQSAVVEVMAKPQRHGEPAGVGHAAGQHAHACGVADDSVEEIGRAHV